jgi:uncharacterized cofD-like protein
MKNKKVVTIGGGTGSFTLLSGLKKYPVNISAIVSMADDGGSTGVLRDELGVLPPGDVRQCLVALSDSSENLRELMNYRFEEGGLKGHSFGNLFLSVLEKTSGGFEKGIDEAIKILNVKGKIIPVTKQDARLFLRLKSGKILKGEDEINQSEIIQREVFGKLYFKPAVKANPRAIKAIMEADLILIGPGGLYTSILPNLLIEGVAEALKKTKATIVYNCNLTNKKGQSENFSMDDYADIINKYIGKKRIDYVVFNSKSPQKKLIKKYEHQHQLLIKFRANDRTRRNYKVIQADVLSDKIPKYSPADFIALTRAFIRHDSEKLAKVLMMLMEMGDYDNLIQKII